MNSLKFYYHTRKSQETQYGAIKGISINTGASDINFV